MESEDDMDSDDTKYESMDISKKKIGSSWKKKKVKGKKKMDRND